MFWRRQKSYRRFLKQKRLDSFIVIFNKRTEDVKWKLGYAIESPQKRTKGQFLESLETDSDFVEAQELVLCKGHSSRGSPQKKKVENERGWQLIWPLQVEPPPSEDARRPFFVFLPILFLCPGIVSFFFSEFFYTIQPQPIFHIVYEYSFKSLQSLWVTGTESAQRIFFFFSEVNRGFSCRQNSFNVVLFSTFLNSCCGTLGCF
jgi:hypothetical protein